MYSKQINLSRVKFFSFPAVSIRVPFAGFICNLLKRFEDRTRDLFTRFVGQYMLLYVPATPQPGKDGFVGAALQRLNLQLARARKLFAKYNISLAKFSMPAGARPHGGFVALLVVGPTSHHSLKEFTDTSGGHHCWERTLLISKEQLQAGFATELKEPCLFATDRQQPPSPGCLCIFGGKVLLADLPAGVDFDILHRTDALQLAREACKQALV